MTAKTTAERVSALRQRREAMGLVRLELYVLPEQVDTIKKYVDRKTRAGIKASGVSMSERIYGAFAQGPKS